MKVGANLLWVVPGVVGGSEEYTVGLLDALADQRDLGDLQDCELTLFVNRRFPLVHRRLCERWPTVVAPVTGRPKGVRVAAESTWLPVAVRRLGLEIVHHMGGLLPVGVPGRRVLTVHDLQPLVMPEHFGPVKQRFHSVALPSSLRRAERVVTLTSYTRDAVCERFGLDPSNVHVLPPGITLAPPAEDEDGGEEVERARTVYGLGDDPYFLYPAITYPHKNHRLLVDALVGLATSHPRARLVLTGGRATAEEDLERTVRMAGLTANVVRPGRVPAADLDALYRGATALTFPSLFEGFGLPVLEAMRRGCPVLAAASTALPEVIGRGGMLLPAEDPREWTAAMALLLDDEHERGRLAAAGRARAADFTWAPSARRLVEVWQEVRAT